MNNLISLKEENRLLKEKINNAIELIENIYNSLENVDRPIIFYEEILKVLKD